MQERNAHFDVAQVCLNGHLITDSLTSHPHDAKGFCPDCGESTITECSECDGLIEGRAYNTWATGYVESYELPSYCKDCGAMFPWLRRSLDAAQELAELIDEFSDEDKEILNASLKDLVKDSPRNQVAVIKTKKVLSKTAPHIQEAFKTILIDVITAPITKQIWG